MQRQLTDTDFHDPLDDIPGFLSELHGELTDICETCADVLVLYRQRYKKELTIPGYDAVLHAVRTLGAVLPPDNQCPPPMSLPPSAAAA